MVMCGVMCSIVTQNIRCEPTDMDDARVQRLLQAGQQHNGMCNGSCKPCQLVDHIRLHNVAQFCPLMQANATILWNNLDVMGNLPSQSGTAVTLHCVT